MQGPQKEMGVQVLAGVIAWRRNSISTSGCSRLNDTVTNFVSPQPLLTQRLNHPHTAERLSTLIK